MVDENPVCPECGGPIGVTSTFCMHCGADLADERSTTTDVGDHSGGTPDDVWMETANEVVDLDAVRSESKASTATQQDLPPEYRSNGGAVDRTTILPEGFAIKAISFVLAIAAGLAVGIGSMYVLSGYVAGWEAFLVGVVVLLGSTATFLRLVPG